MILPIKFYKYSISPLLPNSCRHVPTCSEYAIESLRIHGIFRGSALAIWRILRCNPWGTHGYDPVPPQAKYCKEQHTVGHMKIVYRMPQSEKYLA
jgi:putative membrane protein insertion efficiency factor